VNDLNRLLLDASQQAGDVFVSNAVIGSRFFLRACIVNFHTSMDDVRAVPELLAPLGKHIDGERRPPELRRA
jgi:hypothetical protein